MKVSLEFFIPLVVCAQSVRMSHDNHGKSDSQWKMKEGKLLMDCGPKDRDLIYRVANKFKHKSILEQLVYTFDIDGISRGCLQELARHRTARLTVKSTRYTLKELMGCEITDIRKWCVVPPGLSDEELWLFEVFTWETLNNIQTLLLKGMSNDKVKYLLPESYKTHLMWQIDGRNLQNFLKLRSSKDALPEIQNLATYIFSVLPEDHKYLYQEFMNENNTRTV